MACTILNFKCGNSMHYQILHVETMGYDMSWVFSNVLMCVIIAQLCAVFNARRLCL